MLCRFCFILIHKEFWVIADYVRPVFQIHGFQMADCKTTANSSSVFSPSLWGLSSIITIFTSNYSYRCFVVVPVTAVIEDPVPGWVSNWNGATGLVTAVAKGLVRIIYADRNIILDLVPVDYVSNLIIAAAAKSDRWFVYHSDFLVLTGLRSRCGSVFTYWY